MKTKNFENDGNEAIECECGAWSGERCAWTGPAADTVTVEWVPAYVRQLHVAGRSDGVWPRHGSTLLTVERSCAAHILAQSGDWAHLVTAGGAEATDDGIQAEADRLRASVYAEE